ncbi:MAG: cobalamin-binding protein [Mariprofundaceae bacterium]|nr:cobalamin-binding protein [Mariprofundaceae bacterium]
MKIFVLVGCFFYTLLLVNIAQAEKFERILALAPHACEMLYAIGASSQMVGAVDYCDYPEAAQKLPRVGNYQGIHVEAALRLKPDAAVVMSRNVKGILQLEKMGVTIIVSNPKNFEGIFQDMLRLGQITGHEQEAKKLVSKQRIRLQHVRQHADAHIRVFYELWPDPLLTVGGLSFINALIDEAGGYNIFADIPMDSPRINVESVLRSKPELIIVPLEHRNIEERRIFWQKWLGYTHVQVLAINPDILHRPGPRLMDGLEALQKLFTKVHHP